MPKVSFLIPAFNENATIRTVLEQVDALPLEKQIIIVDDGSTDGTGEAAEEWQQGRDYVVVVRKQNRARARRSVRRSPTSKATSS